ncbi:hypothetical protein DRE_00200 [Drechslerella stenobrocha 248]|uniref:Fe2OG dioxygenase domain-containing protein n=1 Tax=Drechslerella stenobrocha 248 TaxID=1043628 RepID=W7IHX5_9PEZI|nr:hypothetical protein DRE_00200 [Drechslerella stenobrocha 248]
MFARRSTTQLRTRRALLVLDCQNAFLADDASNPMRIPPESVASAIANLTPLVTAFREVGDEVVWVSTDLDGCRESQRRDGVFTDDVGPSTTVSRRNSKKGNKRFSKLQEEITRSICATIEEGVLTTENTGSKSDEYLSEEFVEVHPEFWKAEDRMQRPASIEPFVDDKDLKLTKNDYSAFQIPNFLGILRSRMITEIYFAGAHSNVGVFATIADAAMHGFVMNMIDDCVIYRSRTRHDAAVKEIETDLGFVGLKSADVLRKLGKGDGKDEKGKPNGKGVGEEVAGTGTIRNPTVDPQVVQALVEKLRVSNATDDEEEEGKSPNSKSTHSRKNSTKRASTRAIGNGGSRPSQRASLQSPSQLVSSGKPSERPKSAPISGFQPPPEEPEPSSSPVETPEAKQPTEAGRTPTSQRSQSVDATNLDPDDDEAVRKLKQSIGIRTRAPSTPTPAAPPGQPKTRVRAKVSMRRPVDRKPSVGALEKPDISTTASPADLTRAIGSLNISTISSGEAEKSQAAKDELLKSILGKKMEAGAEKSAVKDQAEKPPEKPLTAKDSPTSTTNTTTDDVNTNTTAPAPSTTESTPDDNSKMSAIESKPTPAPTGDETNAAPPESTAKSTPTEDSASETATESKANPASTEDHTGVVSAEGKASATPTEDEAKVSPTEGESGVAPADTSERPSKDSAPKPSDKQAERAETHASRKHKRKDAAASKLLGPGDTLGEESDTTAVITDFLPDGFSATAFADLKSEVQWRVMHHRGGEVPRLVAVQGTVAEDGSFPVYRHPADESPPLLPFSKTVEAIRAHVERTLKHPVNHVLIQLYRGGTDYISEHSDKTLDIVRGSSIVNVSLGAQRVMTLRTKKKEREDGITGPTAPSPVVAVPDGKENVVAADAKEDKEGGVADTAADPARDIPNQTSSAADLTKDAADSAKETVDTEKDTADSDKGTANVTKDTSNPAEASASPTNASAIVADDKTDAVKVISDTPAEAEPQTLSAAENLQGKEKEKEPGEDEKRIIQKIPLPHNSMFILGLPTNQRWMHSINADRRLAREKSPAELAYDGERISLTFRHIGTFMSADESRIWGQGAISKTQETAGETIVGDEALAEKMVFAFAAENRMAAGFDWDQWYGKGFDVLHFKRRRRKIRLLASDPGGLAVRIAAEVVGWHDVLVEEVRLGQHAGDDGPVLPVLEDVDNEKTVVVGEEAALMFLATAVEEGRKWLLPDVVTRRAEYARCLSGLMEVRRLKGAMELLGVVGSGGGVVVEHPLFAKVHTELKYWDEWYQPRKGVDAGDGDDGGSRVTVVDCAVFPYARRLKELGFLDLPERDGKGLRYDALVRFVKRMEKEKFVKTALKPPAVE